MTLYTEMPGTMTSMGTATSTVESQRPTPVMASTAATVLPEPTLQSSASLSTGVP